MFLLHCPQSPGFHFQAPCGYKGMATALDITSSQKQVPSVKSGVSLCIPLSGRKIFMRSYVGSIPSCPTGQD